jgi:tRNA dimethylallyltransferase
MASEKILIIVGPTASGKSELAVKLARHFNGEIISADSRQIYRGLDIGSGKVEGMWKSGGREGKRGGKKVFLYKSVPHYLIDEASPRVQYSVARFQREGSKVIKDILRRGKLPIICGGTAHWVDALVYGQSLPAVKPNAKLRKQLEKLSLIQLYAKLKKLDPERAAEIDANNPRRLIRALEIVMTTGKPVPKQAQQSRYDAMWLGIKTDQKSLEGKIQKRLRARIKAGMIKEVKKLRKQGLSWKRLESFGLEYKFVTLYLQGKLSRLEMEAQLLLAIRQFAKRQMTWWKRNANIYWSSSQGELTKKAQELVPRR